MHKLVLDGRGQLALLDQLGRAYAGGTGSLGPEDDGFLRYLAWRTGSAVPTGAAREWLRAHGAATGGRSAKRPHPVNRGGWRSGRPWHAALRQVCADHRTTAFTWHLAAFVHAMAGLREEGNPWLPESCAVPMDGRPSIELDETVGGFATIAPLRLDLGDTPPARPGAPAEVFAALRPLAEQLAVLRLVPVSDLQAAEHREADPRLVFSFQRAQGSPLTFAGAACFANGDQTAEQYRLLLQAARLADDLGFEAVWTPTACWAH